MSHGIGNCWSCHRKNLYNSLPLVSLLILKGLWLLRTEAALYLVRFTSIPRTLPGLEETRPHPRSFPSHFHDSHS
jgi:hypothetical protein